MPILLDVARALAALDGRVVHRDVKPENVLLLNGASCLADFGIARYAEASTAPDTWKYAWTAAYTAPERWRQERATAASDVYSFGIVAFEMLAGHRPFPGPAPDDFRDQHLHRDASPLGNVAPALASLVAECLFKAPGSRAVGLQPRHPPRARHRGAIPCCGTPPGREPRSPYRAGESAG